jgi:molybdopterin-guanine dinucleotide biosynthesis protein A
LTARVGETPMVAGAILAGGSARRMGGVAKGLEVVGGRRIVDHVAAALRPLTAEVVLVGAPLAVAASLSGLRSVADEFPGAGPLGGIISALRATRRDTLVVAWDMPFVTEAVLGALLEAPADADASVPRENGQLEPLCALYRTSALEPLARAFDGGERSAVAALGRLRVHRVDREHAGVSPFASVNTPEQLAAARSGHRTLISPNGPT